MTTIPAAQSLTEREPDIAEELRMETKKAHEDAEYLMRSVLFSEDLSPQIYMCLLEMLRFYHGLIDEYFARYTLTSDLMLDRSKLNHLDLDIQYLQTNLAQAELGKYCLSVNYNLHLPLNLPKCLGYMYVFEGATLGGHHIKGHLLKHRWLSDRNGLHYFSSYKSQTPAKWKHFLQILRNYIDTNPNAKDEVIEGAKDSFANFTLLLKGEMNEFT